MFRSPAKNVLLVPSVMSAILHMLRTKITPSAPLFGSGQARSEIASPAASETAPYEETYGVPLPVFEA